MKQTISQRKDELINLYHENKNCLNCSLGKDRTNFVFGSGNPDANIVFCGEAPGEKEDLGGKPFIGRAGKVLDKALNHIDLQRSDVFILNTIKCRPPSNRDPKEDEIISCKPILDRQLEYIQPQVIVCLGRVAASTLLNVKLAMRDLRGKEFSYNDIPVFISYHPAATLYNPKLKDTLYDDFVLIKDNYLC